MDEQLKSNLTSRKHWSRLVYMVLFALFVYVAIFVVAVLIVVQFLFALITGSDNRKLRRLGNGVSDYIHQALLFLTYSSDLKPFPFSDWPDVSPTDEDFFEEERAARAADIRESEGAVQNEVEAPMAATPAAEVEAAVPDAGSAEQGNDEGPGAVRPAKPD